MNRPLSLIPYACGWGAQIHECAEGPQALKDWGLADKLQAAGMDCRWEEFLPASVEVPPHPPYTQELLLAAVADHCALLATQTGEVLVEGRMPVALGGDHSMAVGTWSGVTQTLQMQGRFGLIWVDAHLDAHTPETSPSKSYHGMPVAALLGHGEPELVNLGAAGAKLKPEHLCLIGIRSYEEGEQALLKELGVRIITMDELQERGFADVLKEALEIATTGTAGFGLTIDLDGFDPEVAPGVGSPEAGGIRRRDALPALHGLGNHPALKALEIAEYNPHLDDSEKTRKLVLEIIQAVFGE